MVVHRSKLHPFTGYGDVSISVKTPQVEQKTLNKQKQKSIQILYSDVVNIVIITLPIARIDVSNIRMLGFFMLYIYSNSDKISYYYRRLNRFTMILHETKAVESTKWATY